MALDCTCTAGTSPCEELEVPAAASDFVCPQLLVLADACSMSILRERSHQAS